MKNIRRKTSGPVGRSAVSKQSGGLAGLGGVVEFEAAGVPNPSGVLQVDAHKRRFQRCRVWKADLILE